MRTEDVGKFRARTTGALHRFISGRNFGLRRLGGNGGSGGRGSTGGDGGRVEDPRLEVNPMEGLVGGIGGKGGVGLKANGKDGASMAPRLRIPSVNPALVPGSDRHDIASVSRVKMARQVSGTEQPTAAKADGETGSEA
ncbi:hypothetical protein C8R44DRAFT_747463 [Mycena epipterygia]|nr:hypothetical protein C8R44DRAFT_747463 [Mycena epipterygia]